MNDWKPGDVAMVCSNVAAPEVRIYGEYPPGENGRWYVGHGGFVRAEHVTEAHPLTVIDPENAEQVEKLWVALRDHRALQGRGNLLAALREFANPTPRIEEPTGLGAVVEDDRGCRWVKVDTAMSCDSWTEADAGMSDNPWRKFASLNVVRVLSEGVPS